MTTSESSLPRIYVTSIGFDFDEYRSAIKGVVQICQEDYPDFTVQFSQPTGHVEASLKRIQQSDVLVVVGPPNDTHDASLESLNLTRFEVEAAINAGLEIRAILSLPRMRQEPESTRQKPLALFKQIHADLALHAKTTFFTTHQSLRIEITRTLFEVFYTRGLRFDPESARLVIPTPHHDLSVASGNGYFQMSSAQDGVPLYLKLTHDSHALDKLAVYVTKLLSKCEVPEPDAVAVQILAGARKVSEKRAHKQWWSPAANGFLIKSADSLDTLYRSILSAVTEDAPSKAYAYTPETYLYDEDLSDMLVREKRSTPGLSLDQVGNCMVLKQKDQEDRPHRPYEFEDWGALKGTRFGVRISSRCYSIERTLDHTLECLASYNGQFRIAEVEISEGTRSSRFEAVKKLHAKHKQRGIHFLFSSQQEYHTFLREWLVTDHGLLDSYCEVRLAALTGLVVDATARLASQPDIVHGNLKPGNILHTKNGVTLVDALNVKTGASAPSFCHPWSAPEQAMGEILDPSADVYSICQILVKLLQLRCAGELTTYRATRPSDGEQQDYHFIKNPVVQTHNAKTLQDFPEQTLVRQILEEGLRADKAQRISSMKFLHDRLRQIDFNALSKVHSVSTAFPFYESSVREGNGKYTAFRYIKESIELDPDVLDAPRETNYGEDSMLPLGM